MILITSGAYLGPEFVSELGLLPPSFLPVGNRRLFRIQAGELTRFDAPVFMSIPECFRIHDHDQDMLDALGIRVVRVPQKLTLAQSVMLALCACPTQTNDLRILHGDTLICSLPDELDVFTVGLTSAYYSWAVPSVGLEGELIISEGLSHAGQSREVLSGFFAFSDKAEFVRALALSRDSFIGALNTYASRIGLAPTKAGTWFDFGHLHSYYRSKAHVTTQRHFNSLEISKATVVKSSANQNKMAAEAHWFESLPPSLRVNTPRFICRRDSGYELEYLYLCTLSELLVFGELPGKVWAQIMEACLRFLTRCREEKFSRIEDCISQDLYLPKTLERLDLFSRETGLSLDHPWNVNGITFPGLRQVATDAAALIPPPNKADFCLTHGDLCFSNIFYDFRRQDIMVIDPRGQDFRGRISAHGDIRYDVAKLYHSAVAGYDHVKADICIANQSDKYTLSINISELHRLRDVHYAFLSKIIAPMRFDLKTIKAINVQLFLSMLPLHADRPDHQLSLLSIGMMIYAELIGMSCAKTYSSNRIAA